MPEPTSPYIIADLLTEQEAAAIVNHLRSADVHAMAVGGNLISLFGEASPRRETVQVVVAHADAERAADALTHFHPVAVNWDEVDVGQPDEQEPIS